MSYIESLLNKDQLINVSCQTDSEYKISSNQCSWCVALFALNYDIFNLQVYALSHSINAFAFGSLIIKSLSSSKPSLVPPTANILSLSFLPSS